MPLVGPVDHQIPLLQQHILSFRHGMQLTAVHIGQLRHGMGFPGKQKPLLFFLVEEGIDSLHPGPLVNPQAAALALAHRLRHGLGTDLNGSLPFERFHREIHIFFHGHRLIQIELLKDFPVTADAQHTGATGAGEPGVRPGPVHRSRCLLQIEDQGSPLPRRAGRFPPLRQHRTEALKSHLIQIADHGGFLPG